MNEVNESELNAFLRSNTVQAMPCKYCDALITFKDRQPLNDDGTTHRCMATMDCRNCGKPITFHNRKPFNADGSDHRCMGRQYKPASEAQQNYFDLLGNDKEAT